MTAALWLLAALLVPAPLVLSVVYVGRMVRSLALAHALFLVEEHPLAAPREILALPAPSLGRGDMVDIRGTPFYGLVLCVDQAVAWCIVSKPSPGGHVFLGAAAPRPVPIGQLVLLDRGIPILGALN